MSQTRLRSKLDSVRFSDLLLKNPDIACYVRNLYYIVHNPIPDHELNVLDMLKERSSLQSIELSTVTVTYLYIYSFKEFPAKVLSGCSNLIDLKLRKSLNWPLPKSIRSSSRVQEASYEADS